MCIRDRLKDEILTASENEGARGSISKKMCIRDSHMHDALPNASFIGFTGTPIERDDRSTPAVFGDYIDKYDILRAVEDGVTVPIYYEGRLCLLYTSRCV